ncbi:MAG: hypothetical protein RL454_267 [Actinomycetota bacterium]
MESILIGWIIGGVISFIVIPSKEASLGNTLGGLSMAAILYFSGNIV